MRLDSVRELKTALRQTVIDPMATSPAVANPLRTVLDARKVDLHQG